MKKLDIDIERMRELLSLDALTGVLTWRVSLGGHVMAGRRAGYLRTDGYLAVRIDGRSYYAHRIVWAMHYGEQPPAEIDHVNGIKDDNRPCNLRGATHAQNISNMRKRSRSSSGATGVSWSRAANKWVVQVGMRYKNHYGGVFANKDEAIAKAKVMQLELHGAFASQLRK